MTVTDLVLRWRYALLAVWGAPWVVWASIHRGRGLSDWLLVESGARIIAHHRTVESSGPLLHLYEDHPAIQVGPPGLVLLAPFQWFAPRTVGEVAGVVMALAGLVVLRCLERACPDDVRGRVLLGGLVFVPVWAWSAVLWRHVDDVVALTLAAAALVLVRRKHAGILAGVLLGTAIAAKPWAVLLVPVLLGLPRDRRLHAALTTVVAAAAWWAPFLVADPGNGSALAGLRLVTDPGTLWHALGLTVAPTWTRAVQLGLGPVAALLLARRAGWAAVPFLAMAWRVTIDPYSWPYYVLGPLAFGLLWDLARPRPRRGPWVPWATASAWLVESVLPHVDLSLQPAVRALWFVAALGLALRPRPAVPVVPAPRPPRDQPTSARMASR